MGTINTSDIIFATLTRGRSTILRRTITGIESLSDIVRQIRPSETEGYGLYTLDVRNTTKGWTYRRPLTFSI